MTKKRPTQPGYYWWTNFGEHTPCILHVSRNYMKELWASNEEYNFPISTKPKQQELQLFDEDDIVHQTSETIYRYGDELWGLIPNPAIDGTEVKPDCF